MAAVTLFLVFSFGSATGLIWLAFSRGLRQYPAPAYARLALLSAAAASFVGGSIFALAQTDYLDSGAVQHLSYLAAGSGLSLFFLVVGRYLTLIRPEDYARLPPHLLSGLSPRTAATWARWSGISLIVMAVGGVPITIWFAAQPP